MGKVTPPFGIEQSDCKQIKLKCVPDEIWELIAEEKSRFFKANPKGTISNEKCIYNLIKRSCKLKAIQETKS